MFGIVNAFFMQVLTFFFSLNVPDKIGSWNILPVPG
jgi:hypothetical protein